MSWENIAGLVLGAAAGRADPARDLPRGPLRRLRGGCHLHRGGSLRWDTQVPRPRPRLPRLNVKIAFIVFCQYLLNYLLIIKQNSKMVIIYNKQNLTLTFQQF